MADVFILHAEAASDTSFVRSYLVPELGLAPDRVLLSSDLPLGMTVVEAIEQGVTRSRMTVIVVSPSLLHQGWAVFGEALASHHAMSGGLLVPLLLVECSLPLRLEFRLRLDCRDPTRRATEVARLRALLDLPTPLEREIPCPYPGMRPYTADDAALFCGRRRDIDGLVNRITAGLRELYVIGPSGSGKSSLLCSGVVPYLARIGDPVVGESFTVHMLRPGASPAHRLAMVGLSGPQRTLVVVDQLEEIFTLADRGGRGDFFAKLNELRTVPTCHLAFVVRADFMDELMQSELWPYVQRSYRHEIVPLRGDDLREAITAPARRVGVDLEPALIDRLLMDAASEPGSLPLIQETLVRLWATRERNLLTAAQYVQLGDGAVSGLAVALANRADATFASLDDTGQTIAQRVFVRLVVFGENRHDTRRQLPLSALRAGEPRQQLDTTLQHLIAGRLLTADSDDESGEMLLDLSHEALIESWPRLRGWIDVHRATEPRRRHLEADAAQWSRWIARGRRNVALLDQSQLTELDEWFTPDLQQVIGISDSVREFVAASRASTKMSHRIALLGRSLATITVVAVLSVAAGFGSRACASRDEALPRDAAPIVPITADQRALVEQLTAERAIAIARERRLADEAEGTLQEQLRAKDKELQAANARARANAATSSKPPLTPEEQTGPTCGTVADQEILTLQCPPGLVVREVAFADYGLPLGACGSFSVNPICHSPAAADVVRSQCVGKPTCSIRATDGLFGDPCAGVHKHLSAALTCGE